MNEYAVVYEQGESSWGAYVPDLPGCIAVGDTLEDDKSLFRGSLKMYVESMRQDGDPIPVPKTHVEHVRIAA